MVGVSHNLWYSHVVYISLNYSGDFQTSAAILCCFWNNVQKHIVKKPNIVVTTKIISSLTNSTKSSPTHGSTNNPKASPYLTIGGRLTSLDEQDQPKTVAKSHLDKKSNFWFLKPGALNGALGTTSPYHTIQVGSQIPPPCSTKGILLWCA